MTHSTNPEAPHVGASRPSWDMWAVGVAHAVAQRADCRRRQIGAVILDATHRVLSVGYNGAEPGGRSCLAGECPRGLQSALDVHPGSSYDTGPGSCISIHAEMNALLYADPVRRKGATLYVTAEPCDGCMRPIRASGLARVVYVRNDGMGLVCVQL